MLLLQKENHLHSGSQSLSLPERHSPSNCLPHLYLIVFSLSTGSFLSTYKHVMIATIFKIFFFFIDLAVPSLSCGTQDLLCGMQTLSYSMQDLAPETRIKPGHSALGAQS